MIAQGMKVALTALAVMQGWDERRYPAPPAPLAAVDGYEVRLASLSTGKISSLGAIKAGQMQTSLTRQLPPGQYALSAECPKVRRQTHGGCPVLEIAEAKVGDQVLRWSTAPNYVPFEMPEKTAGLRVSVRVASSPRPSPLFEGRPDGAIVRPEWRERPRPAELNATFQTRLQPLAKGARLKLAFRCTVLADGRLGLCKESGDQTGADATPLLSAFRHVPILSNGFPAANRAVVVDLTLVGQ